MTRLVGRTLTLGLLLAFPAAAQEPAAPETPAKTPTRQDKWTGPPTPLRVQITIGRFEGDKKVTSLPFTLTVNAGEASRTSLRMGIEVPVRVAPSEKDGKAGPFQYRSVGTNIDCRAGGRSEDGRYNVEVRAEQSSVPTADKPSVFAADMPLFRTFNTSFNALLRDGQSTTYVVGTDPITGESVRIDVGLTVLR